MKVELIVDRDSVHAGDDGYSHRKSIVLTEDLPVKQLVERLILNREFNLALISGGNVLWNAEVNGLCVAQVIQNEDYSYEIYGVNRLISDYRNDDNKVGLTFYYFSYSGKHKFTEKEKESSIHFPWSPIYYWAGLDTAKERKVYQGKWGV
ncbi:hypothetical protein AC623_01690 [Bacillus sp. FJAT-27231]|uniref:hypothetical protein n=1 Tax=Bacillus sp. FJAT-27231 TaxID=1679168 RepID=UPI000671063F|nr:hypothetical protein [Bacillus sp. FJAT-27231]KMY52853.1 hypothetical protein AC623_01690 [Bacillus sp. FJAT-27231]